MSQGSNTESYPAFAHIGLRENPGKNLNQVTCPDRESNPVHLVSRLDALTVGWTQEDWLNKYYNINLEDNIPSAVLRPDGRTCFKSVVVVPVVIEEEEKEEEGGGGGGEEEEEEEEEDKYHH
ncbi:hypothetical protein ANN_01525 [Periplaneta americana]|uniref:Uncharacterized protein n=1 Tax=Periplaneta americana TaxID=6978 RepID=A0ABQ8TTT4_PERAM|nr:hypothetical protein ANN_01525 [Periplaneta americana]